MSSPRLLRTTATPNAQTQTTSEAANSAKATPTATGSSASTPSANGAALSAKTTFAIHEVRMIARPARPEA